MIVEVGNIHVPAGRIFAVEEALGFGLLGHSVRSDEGGKCDGHKRITFVVLRSGKGRG
jgi:hypothetical protein